MEAGLTKKEKMCRRKTVRGPQRKNRKPVGETFGPVSLETLAVGVLLSWRLDVLGRSKVERSDLPDSVNGRNMANCCR